MQHKLKKKFWCCPTGASPSYNNILPKWSLCEYVIFHTIVRHGQNILWVDLGGKPKWLPLNSGYHDRMSTSSIIASLNQSKAFQTASGSLSSNRLTHTKHKQKFHVPERLNKGIMTIITKGGRLSKSSTQSNKQTNVQLTSWFLMTLKYFSPSSPKTWKLTVTSLSWPPAVTAAQKRHSRINEHGQCFFFFFFFLNSDRSAFFM